ncbi:hypothetical protein PROFUN_01184 [Planoprotostelium fungivorum]|uniref:Gfo/Idh/MocA-like oxidoreductase N-terminal domain-containing protein n=1 Tax=Planoprotostelium fungivorum TaxID=1890364 RepID=A0A2P6NCJ6_9EUKA|nr:hypothetical protein PROFUN_01184 [Planoprotostelium fungivorum]
MSATNYPPNGLMVGTGEYTTGYVGSSGSQSQSDKKIGVVALTLFDLQTEHRGKKVGQLKMAGTNGKRFPAIRTHLENKIANVYKDISVKFESFPADDVERDTEAYLAALDTLKPGDFITVFTPDDTHYDIAVAALKKKVHVLLTKPPVKTLAEHHELIRLSRENNVLVMVEYHKRFDPAYADARHRVRNFGDFNFVDTYMSQPKFQLDTFRAWAGKSSDISYYLNSHHIDIHCWIMEGRGRPVRVVAMASNGIATGEPYKLDPNTEDTISLLVQWENIPSGNLGTATYTASWATPKTDVHTQQKMYYLGQKGEVSVDQAHRGYIAASDEGGFANVNPFYMKYSPDHLGRFNGQNGYGYQSIAAFVEAVGRLNKGEATLDEFDGHLATGRATITVTAILEAGRRSLDDGGRAIRIKYDDDDKFLPKSLEYVCKDSPAYALNDRMLCYHSLSGALVPEFIHRSITNLAPPSLQFQRITLSLPATHTAIMLNSIGTSRSTSNRIRSQSRSRRMHNTRSAPTGDTPPGDEPGCIGRKQGSSTSSSSGDEESPPGKAVVLPHLGANSYRPDYHQQQELLLLAVETTNVFRGWLSGSGPTSPIVNVVQLPKKIRYTDFQLSDGGHRILTVPNAGGNSVWSEVLSFEVLTGLYGLRLQRTEMELQYMWHGCKITDYSVSISCGNNTSISLGVSVTRAMKFRGTFTREDAESLLVKKLGGVNSSTRHVLQSNGWNKQILHIWAQHKYIAVELMEAYEELSEEIKSNTLIVISVSDSGIIYNKAK